MYALIILEKVIEIIVTINKFLKKLFKLILFQE